MSSLAAMYRWDGVCMEKEDTVLGLALLSRPPMSMMAAAGRLPITFYECKDAANMALVVEKCCG